MVKDTNTNTLSVGLHKNTITLFNLKIGTGLVVLFVCDGGGDLSLDFRRFLDPIFDPPEVVERGLIPEQGLVD